MAIQLSLFSELETPTTEVSTAPPALKFGKHAIRIAKVDENGMNWLVVNDLGPPLGRARMDVRSVPDEHKSMCPVLFGTCVQNTWAVDVDGLLLLARRNEDLTKWAEDQFGVTSSQHAHPAENFYIDGKLVRVVIIDGAPWFVARDICEVMDITWSGATLRFLEGDETRCYPITTNGVTRRMTLVSEAAMYQLVFRGTTVGAKRFTRWVTEKVLPEIRRTGSYSRPGSAVAPSPAPAAVTDPAVLALLTELVTVNRQTLADSRARDRLARFLPSWQIPSDRLRMRMDDLIDTVAEVRGWQRNSVIRQINRVVRDRHHIDFRQRKRWIDQRRGKRVSILSVIERYDKLPMVYDLAVSYYRDDLMATPQRRLSDVPLDRDDPMDEEEHELLKVWEFAMGGPGNEAQ